MILLNNNLKQTNERDVGIESLLAFCHVSVSLSCSNSSNILWFDGQRLILISFYHYLHIITCLRMLCSKSSNSARNKQQFENWEYVSGNMFLSIIMKLSEFSEYSLPKSGEVCPEAAAAAVYCVWCFPHGSPPATSPSPPLWACFESHYGCEVKLTPAWTHRQPLLLCGHLRSMQQVYHLI